MSAWLAVFLCACCLGVGFSLGILFTLHRLGVGSQ